jgi:hypothetical protein
MDIVYMKPVEIMATAKISVFLPEKSALVEIILRNEVKT